MKQSFGNFLHFDTVAETKKQFEYNLGKADVGKLIVCEVPFNTVVQPVEKNINIESSDSLIIVLLIFSLLF